MAAAPLPDPSEATATFRRVDELLRLRLFDEASAEARLLPASRGRDLRLAESEFALGRFAAAAASAKRAFPEMGTAEEGRVPDGWRRLYYPIEEGGFLAERAREFRLDPAILRALVRQESLFEAHAKSRAGALGLTQLLPSTARSVARSVLRVRVPPRLPLRSRASTRARRGVPAAPLRSVRRTIAIFALAAYNGGPGRMAGVREQNPRPRGGRDLRVASGLREPRLRAARDALRRVLPRALSGERRSPRAFRHDEHRAAARGAGAGA